MGDVGYVVAGDTAVDLAAGGVNLLIERHAGMIALQTLSPGEWALLAALAADDNFATACEQALHAEPNLDLGNTLAGLVAQATLIDFRIHEHSNIKAERNERS